MTGRTIALLSFTATALLLLRQPMPNRSSGPARLRRPRRLPADPQRWARPAALIAGGSLMVVSHPATGLLVGAVLWWLLPALVMRMDTGDDVRREAGLAAQLPLTAGLLSACLSSGASLGRSLFVVAQCMPEPARAVLHDAARMAELGAGPPEIVAVFSAQPDPGWQALGAAVRRSSMTGAPLADLLHLQAEQAMTTWATAAAVRARSAAVRTVLPLALCYLPAFLLLGVAPLVAGFVARLDFL